MDVRGLGCPTKLVIPMLDFAIYHMTAVTIPVL